MNQKMSNENPHTQDTPNRAATLMNRIRTGDSYYHPRITLVTITGRKGGAEIDIIKICTKSAMVLY